MKGSRIISLQVVVVALLCLFIVSLEYLSQFIVHIFLSENRIPGFVNILFLAMIIIFYYLFMRLELLKEHSIFNRIPWKAFIAVMILSFFFFSLLFMTTFTFLVELSFEFRWILYVVGSAFLLLIFLSVLASVQLFLTNQHLTRKALDLTLLWSIGIFILIFYIL
ncbi:hypothetical protein [Alkalicoccobacillus porphyridii]|uniref:Uncharacterized protein n=1 Tax=Alkalicoccobacillus porphyridii TaxID=2597270 RepID=A0A553ZYW2_9BACI|nr:hypothetical protein [Alkalicoccobacillus porphyridii]TSB46638.1 hypothetical protein FN960_09790 [Alkalicoccobacillus porphyridii]